MILIMTILLKDIKGEVMNIANNENSDYRWHRGEEEIRPQDKQLCVVIIEESLPIVCQFRKTKHSSEGMFYNIGDVESNFELSLHTLVFWDTVEYWKPLGLPEDINERILAEIDKCFEEDE